MTTTTKEESAEWIIHHRSKGSMERNVFRVMALLVLLTVVVLHQQVSIVRRFRSVSLPHQRGAEQKSMANAVTSSSDSLIENTKQQENLIYGTKISDQLDSFNTSESTIHKIARSSDRPMHNYTFPQQLNSFSTSQSAPASSAKQHHASFHASDNKASIPLHDNSKEVQQREVNATKIKKELEAKGDNLWNLSQSDQAPNHPNVAISVPFNHNTNDKPVEQQRFTATQILDLLETGTFNISHVPLVFPKPPSDAYDIASIYSKKAWIQLRNLFLGKNNNKRVRVCVNGGSSSTGCPYITAHDRWHNVFAKAFRNVTIADRAHGARDSMHTAHLMHSFLPRNTHVIFWEFAINDASYYQYTDVPLKMKEVRNHLILWLDQVARVAQRRRKQAKPPLVVLVYLWNQGQFEQHIPKMMMSDFAYHAHEGLAEQYDFVVGHVNVGVYLESQWGQNASRKYFMADAAHASLLSHRVISYLLYDFVMDKQRKVRKRSNTMGSPRTTTTTTTTTAATTTTTASPPPPRPSISWTCGDETLQQRLLRDLIMYHYPIADYTAEVPKNDQLLPGMLSPVVSAGHSITIQNLGISSDFRNDRKYSVTVPCCRYDNGTSSSSSSSSSSSWMSFENIRQHGVIQGMHLSVFPNASGLTVYVDEQNVTEHNLIDCSTNATLWKCNFSDKFNILYYWVVLEAERHNVSRIAFCNHLDTCQQQQQQRAASDHQSSSTDQLSLQSVTVYGRRTTEER